jgi:hypothetical protein
VSSTKLDPTSRIVHTLFGNINLLDLPGPSKLFGPNRPTPTEPTGPPDQADQPKYIATSEIANISESPESQGIRITSISLRCATKVASKRLRLSKIRTHESCSYESRKICMLEITSPTIANP